MLEAQAIALALGVKFPIDVDKRIAGAAAVGAHKTSMLQDLERGRKLETDALVASVKTWFAALLRAIVQAREAGHLRADVDCQQMAFEIHGLILALHFEARFLDDPGAIDRANKGFLHILSRHAAAVGPPGAAPTPPYAG